MTLISTGSHPPTGRPGKITNVADSALDRAALARYLDHTLLAPEATASMVEQLCVAAVELGVFAACVSPSFASLARSVLGRQGTALACVCGFPSGAHRSDVKAAEAERAAEDGADEIDVVINLGAAAAGDWVAVERDLRVVREAVPKPLVLKVILETGLFADAAIRDGCAAAEAAGADFVKTSTGFHPSGGATIEAVATMAASVGGRLGVKASGGIRTAEAAMTMIAAGATRIGTSSSAAILAGAPA
jgi:deoxyribose-phosphate aldolase